MIKDFFGGAGSILYTIADAVVSNSDIVTTTTEQNNDWLSGITYYMESVLKVCFFRFSLFCIILLGQGIL